MLFFPAVLLLLAVYCPLPQKAFCNLNQDACEPDRSSVSACWRMRGKNADSAPISSSETLTG